MVTTNQLTAKAVNGKAVLVRGDLDVEDGQNPRTESIRSLITWLLASSAGRIKVIGHRETDFPICDVLKKEFPGVEFDDRLRDNPGEKNNDSEFANKLAEGWDVYVNEAFATSHRRHASIDQLPRLMKEKYLGPRFHKELEILDLVRLRLQSKSKSVLVIGGTKVDDKERFAVQMKDKFAEILKGGLLPGVDLRPDGLDISDAAIEKYKQVISEAEVILAAGVMGKYEDPAAECGTREILMAIAQNTNAYKVAGGGDIETAIGRYGLTEKFDWISVGGGAMLVYLSTGSLFGLEAFE